MIKKRTSEQFKTKVGELRWINITGEGKPDLKGVMKYNGQIFFKTDSPQCVELKKKILDFWENYKPINADPVPDTTGFKREEIKDDDGNKSFTDMTYFKFWTHIKHKDGKQQIVNVYSAGNKAEGIKPTKISLGDKSIGNGSIGAIAGTMDIYQGLTGNGVSLYLNAIQLHKLVEYSKDPGFDAADDGGYEGEVEESVDTFDNLKESVDTFDSLEEVSKEPAKPRI